MKIVVEGRGFSPAVTANSAEAIFMRGGDLKDHAIYAQDDTFGFVHSFLRLGLLYVAPRGAPRARPHQQDFLYKRVAQDISDGSTCQKLNASITPIVT